MVWAGTTICGYTLPVRGRRVAIQWLGNDESFFWNDDEDYYGDLE